MIPRPPIELFPNSRFHWRRKADKTALYRKLVWALSINALMGRTPPRWKRARIRIDWYVTGTMSHDPDNIIAGLKAAFDGLQDAGVISSDRGVSFDGPHIHFKTHWDEVKLTVRGSETETPNQKSIK